MKITHGLGTEKNKKERRSLKEKGVVFPGRISNFKQNCFLESVGNQDQFQLARIRALPLMANKKRLGTLEK